MLVSKPLCIYEKWNDLVTKLHHATLKNSKHAISRSFDIFSVSLASEISISIFSKIGSVCASIVWIAAKISGRALANAREHSRISYSWNKTRVYREDVLRCITAVEKKVENPCIFHAVTRFSFRRAETRCTFRQCVFLLYQAHVLEQSSRFTSKCIVTNTRRLQTYMWIEFNEISTKLFTFQMIGNRCY